MNKPVLAEATTLAAFATVAVAFADLLADHHVSDLAILAVSLFILTSGMFLGDAFGRALRTRLYRCPTRHCPVAITAPRNLGEDALRHYRTQATDHTLHTATEATR